MEVPTETVRKPPSRGKKEMKQNGLTKNYDYPSKAAEPKVMVPYENPPGGVPRKIVIERKRRLFEMQSIEELLMMEGVDYRKPPDENSFEKYLPLEVFDDTEFDSRTCSEWIDLGVDENGKFHYVPAKALFFEENQKGYWKDCKVLKVNEDENKYLVSGSSGDPIWLPRIHILFKAEDPFIFSKRVAHAHKKRKQAESLIRYNLYIDSMPTDEIPAIGAERLEMIKNLAINADKIKRAQSYLSVDQNMEELESNYARSMNKIIFDANMRDPSQQELFSFLALPEESQRSSAPWLGTIQVPPYDYECNKKKFQFQTYISEEHILSALFNVKNELLHKQQMRIFTVPVRAGVPVTLDEFERVQTQSLEKIISVLKDNWLITLSNHIKSSLQNIGKGWLNIHEKNKEIYEMSKLKRFMNAVKFMMEDSIRVLLSDSLEDYVNHILSSCGFEVSINSLSDVEVRHGDDDSKARPMFSTEITFNKKFDYSTEVQRYSTVLLQLFDRAVEEFQKIPQVEPLVMDQFFWSGETKFLQTLRPSDTVVQKWRQTIEIQISKAILPLNSYLDLFEEYRSLLDINNADYIKSYESMNHTLEEMKKEIQKHFRLKKDVSQKIPSRITVGNFVLECGNVKQYLQKKAHSLGTEVLNHLARCAKNKSSHIRDSYLKLSREINKPPQNIEQLTKLREDIKNIAQHSEQIENEIVEMKQYYEMLDFFKTNLSDEDFKQKCSAIGWPKRLSEQVEHIDSQLSKETERFREKMIADQSMFEKEIEKINRVISTFSKHTDLGRVGEVAHEVKLLKKQIKECKEKSRDFNNKEILFGVDVTEYRPLQQVELIFQPYADLWLTANDWINWYSGWMNDPFESLDGEKIRDDVKKSYTTMQKCINAFKESPPIQKIAKNILKKIQDFQPDLPLLISLRNPGLRERHWKEIATVVEMELEPGVTFKTLKDLLDLNLGEHLEKIQKIANSASQEFTIEKALSDMKEAWSSTEIEVKPYSNTGTYVMKISEEIQQQLDDHIVLTQTINFSAHKKHFEAEIMQWDTQLSFVSEVLEEWLNCQREWIALEPIFSSPEIAKQLPALHKKFKQVDTKWRSIMDECLQNPKIMSFCSGKPKLLKSFQENNALLDSIQKGLNKYLESKRKQFARLYFLADDELLIILAQSKEPRAVQPFLKKCFENIQELHFEDNDEMTAMYSKENERIAFSESILAAGSVEIWLKQVEGMMKKSVQRVLKDALVDYTETPRKKWVLSWPGQIIIVGSQIFWTKEVTEALSREGKQGLKKYHEKLVKQLIEITEIVRTNISKLDRVRLSALLTIDVHARDVIEQMIEANAESINDFEWVSQLRYYWEDDSCIVRQVEATFEYGYEYLGNTSRLVITPLTDRIYLTLTGALHLGLGGAPAGPAGTGKTETVKDLAKALAKQCVIFNCQEGLDEFAMGKFFKGLIMAGAWACFDEFNRIDAEVLSVVAQQITTLQDAVRAKLQVCEFENTTVTVDPTFAVFITMNPGYAGRTELPDNLKALFRPVACMVPDYALIGEIRLFSFGFQNAKPLSKKMVATFNLSSEQLSSQYHYDFGMRAVNTVIEAAGLLKREDPSYDEELLLLRALRDSNIPKFLSNDVILFNGIISDLFPKVKPPKVDYGMLITEIESACEVMKLEFTEVFRQKCIQLYETTVLRHGLMLVGQTGSGKTSCYKVLQRAMREISKKDPKNEKFKAVKTTVINPKCVKMWQLYGEYDKNTREWKDGILANEFRKFAERDTSDTFKWLIFDGPVDALWIESMNTVLDENKRLCLVSGAIIEMVPTMKIVFEVEDLAVASPATVSRCGMVFLDPKLTIPINAHITKWVKELDGYLKDHEERFTYLFTSFLEPMLEFIRSDPIFKEYVQTVDENLIHSCFKLLNTILKPYRELGNSKEDKEKANTLSKAIDSLFIFAFYWGIGGTCDLKSREIFDTKMRSMIKQYNVQIDSLPSEGLIYDYYYDYSNYVWVHWLKTIPDVKIDAKMNFKDIIVPTTDSIRYSWLLENLLKNNRHVLCVGPTGTGKTLTVQETLMKRIGDKYIPLFVYFSARTDENKVQDIIDSKLEKLRPRVYVPPQGKDYVIFIDDLNMPAREKYGAQPPIELLRQWMDHGGWYEYNNPRLDYRHIERVVFVGAMGPPGGGRNVVTNRFLRHFNFIAFPEMDDSNMRRIFSSMIEPFLVAYYPEEVQQIGNTLVDASILLYNQVRKEMLPRPSKSHYTFNLRDISKIFQGLLDADKKISQKIPFIRLWCHECNRVFRDRLVNNTDRQIFDSLLGDTLKELFDLERCDVIDNSRRLIFGDFMGSSEKKVYEEISDMNELVRAMNEALEYYNNTSDTNMTLVLFLDAIEHVSRISRIIRQPGGNALLLGVGGSGRQSLTKLAASMADYKLFQVEITKGFGEKEWREFLKKMLLSAGVDNLPVVFLFSDTQILREIFLEDINNLLNSGDIPNLYDVTDLEAVYNAMKTVCAAERLPTTPISMFSRFVKRIKENLRMVIAMSPSGEIFRNRLRMFPSLVSCCTIDWFSEWPNDALLSVAEAQLGKLEIRDSNNVYELCVKIHQSVRKATEEYLVELNRYNHVTPTSYLELLTTFETLLEEGEKKIITQKKRFEVGLQILKNTEKRVQELREMLAKKKPQLIEKQKQIEINMIKIKQDKEDAAKTMEIVQKEEEEASTKKEECEANKASVKADLDKAEPLLDKAVKNLKNLKITDIKEVSTYGVPPNGVKLVMKAVCVMMDEPPTRVAKEGRVTWDWWDPSKKLLLNPKKLRDDMLGYNKENIPDKIISKVEEFIQNEEFDPKKIKNVSQACTAMCEWVIAMYTYNEVSKKVEPKRQALKVAEAELKEVEERLNLAKSKLEEVQNKIKELENENEMAVQEQERLRQEVEDCETKLIRAEKLIDGLGGEKVRWEKTLEECTLQQSNIVGDTIISAGFVAYLGVFTSDFRKKLVNDWKRQLQERNIPFSNDYNFLNVVEPLQIRQWTQYGLPSDQISVENAIILNKARRWPLLIDPQMQANKWIKNMQKESGLKVISFSQKDYLKTLMNAVQFGNPVLLENVGEELDPTIDPILQKQIFIQHGAPYIRIGEDAIPFNPDFKLYITTKHRNPKYSPETSVKVTLLNFFITSQGLEDQLLGTVVRLETPELEQMKINLMLKSVKLNKDLKDIQDNILQMLSDNEDGDILANEKLISALGESKIASISIKEQVMDAERTEKDIDVTRNKYRPIAFTGSVLFFCISDMANIDPMYQYSLQWFIKLFIQSIEDAEKDEDIEQRLHNLKDHFTYSLYNNVCQSLFENHKLLFSFILCLRQLQAVGKVNTEEYRFLLTGGVQSQSHISKPGADWITKQMWNDICSLSKLPAFDGLIDSIGNNVGSFMTFYESPNPHMAILPDGWEEKVDLFQKLLIIRCLRPDKIPEAIVHFVSNSEGEKFVEPPRFDLSRSFKDSSNVTPLVFVLSAGTDPKSEIDKFALSMRVKKLESISLGRGTETKADTAVKDAIIAGSWVLLQNCHLATSFMPALEKIVEDFSNENHRDFRLWLTSMPTKHFPVSILQNSVKLTLEPPKGLKSNLRSSYDNFDDNFLESCSKPIQLKKLLLGLCLFHAVIQERRKFGPLGWNIPYEYTSGDLKICIQQLQILLDKYDSVPYKVIKFLTGQINYGGRVTDDWDRRTLMTIIETYLCPEIMEDGYKFSSVDAYYSIPAGEYKDYIEYLEQLPLNAPPEIFSLHPNAEVTYNTTEMTILTETILSMQPRGSSGSKDNDTVIENTVNQIMKEIPDPFDEILVSKKYPTKYEESMNTVIVQEVARYNKLIRIVKRSLKEISNAIKGLDVMSNELEIMGGSLFNNQVPSLWSEVSYPSLMPLGSWVNDLKARLSFIQNWIDNGTPNVFWVSGFFFPQGFLTGTKQNYARKHTVAIDTVSFAFHIISKSESEISSKPEEGCYVKGLFLEGAGWNATKGLLEESKPKELYTKMPIIWFKPEVKRKVPETGIYICPVYKTLRRAGTLSTTGHSTNFVLPIELPSDKPQAHWIRRGVACILSLRFVT